MAFVKHFYPSHQAVVFQVGDSGRLHHDSPSALSQSEAVHREHRGPGSGGQGAGSGESTYTEPRRSV